jgi:predicted RNA-binding protein associated with RNAse of E/G family
VDITEPIHWDGADACTLDAVVDLFLDVWITPDGAHDVLDQDELEEAAGLGHVTPTQVRAAHDALRTVVSQIASGTFPPEVVVRWNRSHHDIFNAMVNP